MSSHLKKITEAVLAFIEADSWSESREIIEQNHELLFSEDADFVLGSLLEQYQNDAETSKMLQEHRNLLKECREDGIETAFAKKMSQTIPLGLPPELMGRLLAVSSEEEMTELTESHPEIQAALDKLADVARQALAEIITEREEEEQKSKSMLAVHLTPETRQALANKLKLFISKETLEETEAYLQEHPELVSEEGLAVMEILIKRALRAGDQEIIELFMEHYDLLSDAFDEKIDEELGEFFFDREPLNIWHLLNELLECEDDEEVVELVEDYPELLSDHVDIMIEQSIAHARIDGHLGGEEWANHLQAKHAILREVRELEQ